MRTLDRYVLRRHVGPFFFALATITFLFVMRVLVDFLSLFATRHLDTWTVIEIFILSLGWIFALTFPMSVLVAVVMAFGRLSQDAELDAIHAGGVSFRRVLAPVLGAAVVLTGGLFVYNDVVLPEANHRLKTLTADIHKMRPTIAIREGVFMEDFEGYTLLVREVDHDKNIVRDVTAYAIDPKEPVRTIHAPWGELLWENEGDRLVIRLHDGEMHEVDPDAPESYFLLHFDVHNLVFDALGTRLSHSGETSRGDRELSTEAMRALVRQLRGERAAEADSLTRAVAAATSELRSAVRALAGPAVTDIRPADLSSQARMLLRKVGSGQHRMESEQLDINRYEVEIHKKWAFPVACLVFVLIGAPLGARVRRGSLGVGGGLAFLFFLVYYMASLGGEKLGDRGYVPPALGMWAMDLVLGVVGVYLVAHRDGLLRPRRSRS
jgi:lipopolysaccharide export system permease protein